MPTPQDPVQDNPQTDGTPGTETGDTLTDVLSGIADEPETEPKADKEPDEGTKDNSEPEQPELPKWTAQLPEDMRKDAELLKQLGKFEKLGDLAKSYSELEKKLGTSLTKPAEGASPEEVESFYQKLGKPSTADGYTMKGEEAKEFRELAFNNNLTAEQAESLYKAITAKAQTVMQSQKAKLAEAAANMETALKKEYGNQYGEKVKMLKKAVSQNGGNALGNKLKASGLLFDPVMVKLLISYGEMTSEAGTFSKGNSAGEAYKSIADGGTMKFKGLGD